MNNIGKIIGVYKGHPLNKKSILSRVIKYRGTLINVSELDLAVDNNAEITDQNHIGGIEFVRKMAEIIQITKNMKILDLGCGQGGSARILAHFYGCNVLGVDVSENRIQDAKYLTALVNLDQLVTFKQGEIFDHIYQSSGFDVVWGQAAWSHVLDQCRLLDLITNCLKPGGWIAFEDALTIVEPNNFECLTSMENLKNIWLSEFPTVSLWKEQLAEYGFSICTIDNLSNEFIAYYSHLLTKRSEYINSDGLSFEEQGWREAVKLGKKNILGYFRFVGKLVT